MSVVKMGEFTIIVSMPLQPTKGAVPTFCKVGGYVILFSPVQPENALDSNVMRDEGSDIPDRSLHPENAPFSIVKTEGGRFIDARAVPANALAPISVSEEEASNITVVKLLL